MSNLSQVSTTLKSLREVISFAVTLAAIVAAGVLGWQSLAEKPTREEVDMKIAAGAAEREAMRKTLLTHGQKLVHIGQVQEFQIAQARWQGDVLTHMAQKRRGSPPARPESLRLLADSFLSTQ